MKTYITTLFCAITSIEIINCARILGIVGMPSYSHQVVFRPIWKELSLRGHQVTVLTTDPMKDPSLTNLTEVDWNYAYEIIKQHDLIGYFAENVLKVWNLYAKFEEMSYDLFDYQMTRPEVKKMIHDETESFDVILVEMLLLPHLAFSTRFNCPYIGLISADAITHLHEAMGNPTNPSMYPDIMLPFEGKLTFFDRLISFLFENVMKVLISGMMPTQDKLIKKYFGDGIPPAYDLCRNATMLFANANPILHSIRPVTPATILIGGGIHLTESKALPKVGVSSLCKLSP